MGKLRRFLMLEGARPADPDGARPGGRRVSQRFAAVEPGGPASEPAGMATDAPEAASDGTGGEGGDDGEARPAIRCPRCATENGRFVATCVGCGDGLGTAGVVAFNRRLWRDERPARDAARAARIAGQQAEVDAIAARRRAGAEAEVERRFALAVAAERERSHPLVAWLVRLLAFLGRRTRRGWWDRG